MKLEKSDGLKFAIYFGQIVFSMFLAFVVIYSVLYLIIEVVK